MTARMLRLLVLLCLAQPAAAQTVPQDADKPGDTATAQDADEPENPAILVTGRLPHCKPWPGDPLDSVDMAPAAARPRQQVIKPDPATGVLGIFPDDDPILGPGVWQRAGTRMDQYVFRAPQDGSPMCIGARNGGPSGWGQLRQVIDATPYRGKIVRVTMWVASNKAGRIWFWVASGRPGNPGGSRRADAATETGNIEFRGSHTWTPVSLEMGPVRCDQEKLSFGFMLDGPGDVWVYKPQIEVIGTQSAKEMARDCRKVSGRR